MTHKNFSIPVTILFLALSIQSFAENLGRVYDPLNPLTQSSRESESHVRSTLQMVHPTVVCYLRQSDGQEISMSETAYLGYMKNRTHQNVTARCVEVTNPGLPPGSMGGIVRIYDEKDLPRVMAQSSNCRIELIGVVANSNSPTVSVECENQFVFIKKYERMNKASIDAVIRYYASLYTSIDFERQKALGQYRKAICTDPDLEKARAAAQAGTRYETSRISSLSCVVSAGQ